MLKALRIIALIIGLVLAGQELAPSKAMAQGTPTTAVAPATDSLPLGLGLRAIGMGLTILGAGIGIGLTAKGTVESYARQPEMQGASFLVFIIGAALVEGAAFAMLIIAGFII